MTGGAQPAGRGLGGSREDAGSRASPAPPYAVGCGAGSVQLLLKLLGAALLSPALTAAQPGPSHLWPMPAAGRAPHLLGSRALVAN